MFLQISGQVTLVGRVDPINLLEPRINLEVAGPDRDFRQIEAVVDTGFNGWLALTRDMVDELHLTSYGHRYSVLADGTRAVLGIFSALVWWGGRFRPVLIHQVESGRPLVGTSMLENYRLTIDMRQGGQVTIGPMP